MKTAGVRELKARLSAYLREVSEGETVLVTDRGRVVAEIRPPRQATDLAPSVAKGRARLIERGLLLPAREPGAFRLAGRSDLRLPPGTAAELLAAEREE